MKKKKKRIHSLSKRLTHYIMLALFVIMGGMSWLIWLFVDAMLGLNGWGEKSEKLENSKAMVEQVLNDVYLATINSERQIEQNLHRPNILFAMMENLVRINPHIRSCGISFSEGYYPAKGRLFCPYAVRRDSTHIDTSDNGIHGHDYLSEDWFVTALAADSCIWSEPYFEGNDSLTPLLACMLPIHDREGRAVAVLGVDLSLEWLSRELGERDKVIRNSELFEDTDEDESYGNIFTFIIDSTGNYIAHPDAKKILRNNFMTEAKNSPDSLDDLTAKEMMAGENNLHGYTTDQRKQDVEGHESFIIFTPIRQVGWSIGMVMPLAYFEIWSWVFAFFLGLFILLALLVVYIVGRLSMWRATKPLKKLAATAQEVAQGKFDTALPEIRHNDEVRQLRDSFEKMQHSLTNYVTELQQTTAVKATMESELNVAHNIQMAMLPKTFPPYPERSDIDIYGLVRPAKAVGGDLFDFFLRDEKLFFAVGDVSGKGVSASLIMAVTRTLLRNVSAHVNEPNAIVNALNDVLTEDNEINMFVTLFVGVLHLATGQLFYCNAGHDAPLLVADNVSMLPCDPNLPLGVEPHWQFTMQQVTLQPHTTIFAFTDGLNEAENSAHQQFGDERIIKVAEAQIALQRHQPTPLIEAMTQAMTAFVDGAEQSDDLTMLAIEYRPKA